MPQNMSQGPRAILSLTSLAGIWVILLSAFEAADLRAAACSFDMAVTGEKRVEARSQKRVE